MYALATCVSIVHPTRDWSDETDSLRPETSSDARISSRVPAPRRHGVHTVISAQVWSSCRDFSAG